MLVLRERLVLLVGARKYERSGGTPVVYACCAGLATADRGRPPFLADRGVFRRKMYILGLYCSREPKRLELHRMYELQQRILGHRIRRPIAINRDGFSMMFPLLRERCIVE